MSHFCLERDVPPSKYFSIKSINFLQFSKYNNLKSICSKSCPRNVYQMSITYSICFQLIHLKTKARLRKHHYTSQFTLYSATNIKHCGLWLEILNMFAQCIIWQTITSSLFPLNACELTISSMFHSSISRYMGVIFITHFLNIHRLNNTIIQPFYIQMLSYGFYQKEW